MDVATQIIQSIKQGLVKILARIPIDVTTLDGLVEVYILLDAISEQLSTQENVQLAMRKEMDEMAERMLELERKITNKSNHEPGTDA